jgi:hypothetical protein
MSSSVCRFAPSKSQKPRNHNEEHGKRGDRDDTERDAQPAGHAILQQPIRDGGNEDDPRAQHQIVQCAVFHRATLAAAGRQRPE